MQVDGSLLNIGIIDEPGTPFNQFDTGNNNTEQSLEKRIFVENQKYSGQPHITLVVVTTLSQTVIDPRLSVLVGLDDLRGAYLAQHDYNQNEQNKIKLRLLIANIGTKLAAVTTVPYLVTQIVDLANSDSTFMGVMGFPFSKSALVAISHFPTNSSIPIISPSASSSDLSHSLKFYRVVPSDMEEGPDIANFIVNELKPMHVAVFIDQGDPYSHSLGISVAASIPNAKEEYYQVGYPDSLNAPLNDVLSHEYDLIFFAGYADDLNALKDKLKEEMRQNIVIVGGEALNEFGGYTDGNYAHLYFTTFASYAEVMANGNNHFLNEYRSTFDPTNTHPGQYGYSLPGPHVILSYDAINVFLNALPLASNGTGIPTREDLLVTLPNVTFNGLSGLISFNTQSSDPVRKVVYVTCTDSHGYTQAVATYEVQLPPEISPSQLRSCTS